MIKQVILGAALLVAMTSLPAISAYANNGQGQGQGQNNGNNTKVFVCKYVGTPGVDERLQTGNNPISVSVNAIKDYKGVGSYFVDAQGRSFVLAEDTRTGGGQEGEPSADQCPAPVVPDDSDSPGNPDTPGEPGKGDITPPAQNQTPSPVEVKATMARTTLPVAASGAETLPDTAGDHTLAIALIAAGLATIVTGLIIGINALYRHSV
jgi:hypothetical protein